MRAPEPPPNKRPLKSPDKSERLAAADWLARRDAGLSSEEHVQYHEWLLADSRRSALVAEIETTRRILLAPRNAGKAEFAIRELAARKRRRARRYWSMAAVSLAAAATIIIIFNSTLTKPSGLKVLASEPLVKIARQPERWTLSDGSVIRLDPGAEVQVDFSPAWRKVRLRHGLADFTVAKNAGRPFVVSAGDIEVRAVGTEFAVRYAEHLVDVVVTEGRVAVQPTEHPDRAAPLPESKPVYVAAGGHVVVQAEIALDEPTQMRLVNTSEVKSNAVWRGRHIEFEGTLLSEAMASFNRQNHVQLSLGDPSLAELRITGVFWADDPDGFARLLESSLGIKAVRQSDDQIVLFRAP